MGELCNRCIQASLGWVRIQVTNEYPMEGKQMEGRNQEKSPIMEWSSYSIVNPHPNSDQDRYLADLGPDLVIYYIVLEFAPISQHSSML